MVKKVRLGDIILKTLKNGALKVPEIKERINESPEWKSLINPEKTFKESLVRLLTRDMIFIDGYESDDDTSTALKFDCLLFSRVHTELSPIEIENLIYKGFFPDQPDMDSVKDIKELFSGKIKKLILKWNETQKNIHIDILTPKVALWLEAERLLINNLQKEPWELNAEEYEKWIRYYVERFKSSNEPHHEIKSLLKKYKHYKIRFLENEVIDNLIPLHNPVRSKKFRMYHLVKNPELTDDEFLTKEIEVQGLKGKSDEEIEAYLVFTWPVSDEKFIEGKLGFSRPYEGDWHMKELFNQVIKYLKLRESDKKGFISKLAYALSDDIESDKFLIDIIDEVKAS